MSHYVTRLLTVALAGALLASAAPAAFAQSATTAPAAAAPPEPVRPIRASKIILIGDSTTQSNSGWGGRFCSDHVVSFVACLNLARGGRSTSNYRAEGSWDIALAEMSTGAYVDTYVLIQFGHNDQPGKPGRSTDLATEFPQNLRRYVAEVRAKGAIPVLVTPLTRRQFVDGKLDNDLEPWAASIRAVAAETNTPLLDLNADSAAAVEAMGPSLAAGFAQSPPSPIVAAALLTGTTVPANTGAPVPAAPAAGAAPAPTQNNAAVEPMGDAKLSFDYTHLGPTGAAFFSAMVTRELALAVPALRRNLIN
ncbi:rhamnogalacturonan acetylesterase [Brevundimonas goettingensis]|uniref:Rhamnogalacturonan acetylesterase n=1 Tax=Brevundimonas goettingensis TaxID=2774190 RepID=A0A975GV92_9CAUL|nr:rhamnogalacturonan acetylesterase [Brevundimonas goettingensis]